LGCGALWLGVCCATTGLVIGFEYWRFFAACPHPPPNYRWRNRFGGLKTEDAKRHKDLVRENASSAT